MDDKSKPNPIIKGRHGREFLNGATVESDNYTHIGYSLHMVTECGKGIDEFFITYADVEITCPDCAKKIRKKAKHSPKPE